MMSGDISPWTSLVTSRHCDKPIFMASLEAVLQPLADMRDVVLGLPAAFDPDAAVGAQLDAVGEWAGVTRKIGTPFTDVYFSLDVEGLGLDQGTLWAPGDPLTKMVSLPDDAYRTLLHAKIASNHWDGTIPSAYASWEALFSGTPYTVQIHDLGSMKMKCVLVGSPDVVTLALFNGGYLNIKPVGVGVSTEILGDYSSSAALVSGASLGETALGEL
jgi:hypothetical protein